MSKQRKLNYANLAKLKWVKWLKVEVMLPQCNQNATAWNLLRLPAGLSQGKPLNFKKYPPASYTARGHHGYARQTGTIIRA